MTARLDGLRQMRFEMFPMVRYTGHAALSPERYDNFVLSDDTIIGATVAPGLAEFSFVYELFSPS